ncbi:MAG: DNA mismatch repair protein MutS [Pyrinomonadaceae bacterium]
MSSAPTPMLRQYLELKEKYPGTILFFRLGDFYEMFNDDAIIGSKVLDITLTARQKNTENPIPMCGIPHHAAAGYIAKFVRAGYRVAICEQTEEATPGKKLVNRDVVRIITPGTAIDEQLLDSSVPTYLAALCGSGGGYGIAYLDLSTGEFSAVEFEGAGAWRSLISDLETIEPGELLFPKGLKPLLESEFGAIGNDSIKPGGLFESENSSRNTSITFTELIDSTFVSKTATDLLKHQFEISDLSVLGLENSPLAVLAAGACLQYAFDTQKAAVTHIKGIRLIDRKDHMVLDALTIRNLELVRSTSDKSAKTLVGILDETCTPMGSRELRSWLLRPSMNLREIDARKSAVRDLMMPILRGQIRSELKKVSDLERLIGRVSLGTANPRDFNLIADSIDGFPSIEAGLAEMESVFGGMLAPDLQGLGHISDAIKSTISDDPPALIGDGGFIRDGFNPELDELRGISLSAKQTIAGFEEAARQETGIGALHIKFNNVFGYFIEVSKSNLSKVPEHFERKQTLANAERFTTPELKQWEQKVLGAEEEIRSLENKLFKELSGFVNKHSRELQRAAKAIATIDTLASLAETADRRGYTEPELHAGDELLVKNGRHPVVEAYATEPFVPNDILLNNSTDRLLIITGANMGGKSTLLRQVALIQILAQIGSFVPASKAKIPICDRVWTRVGASDDLASGRSTFMVEMTETATILRNATPRSLILLDEIGRGTSTFDGLAIAWAVSEYLHDSAEHAAKTLFATHYHELTELAEKLKGAKNYRISAKEIDGKVVFLHKLEAGKASQSYGIAVGRLAGLPVEVVSRAEEVLKILEEFELAVISKDSTRKGLAAAVAGANATEAVAQISLFAVSNEALIDELRETDLDQISESEALEALRRLKSRII